MSEASEIDNLTIFAHELAKASGQAILPHFRSNLAVDNKLAQGWDPVTEGDRAAERVIRDMIEKRFPTHGIIGEEFGEKKGSSGYTWILDPIDGTRAFVIGKPTWGTLIGLYRDGKPYFGMMHQPYIGESFFGSEVSGSFLKNRFGTTALKVAAPKPLRQALAGTTSPHLYEDQASFERLRKSVQMMRYGGDCYFFALLAAGHLDIALDPGLQIYDIAALLPIIRGAGGVAQAWDGGDESRGGKVLTASSQSLFEEAKSVLNDQP